MKNLITIEYLSFSFILQFLAYALCIDTGIHTQLIVLQQPKSSKDGITITVRNGRIGYPHSCSFDDVVSVLRSQRCMQKRKLRIVWHLLTEIVFKQRTGYIADNLVFCSTSHHLRIDGLQFPLIVYLGILHEVMLEQGLQLFGIYILVLLIERLLRTVSTCNLLFGSSIEFQQVFHLLAKLIHVDIDTVRFIPMLYLRLVEDRHKVDVEILLRLRGAALGWISQENIAIKHGLMRLPVDAMTINLESFAILLHLNRQILHQEIEEMAIFLIHIHRLHIVFNFLLIVHTTLDT